MAQHSNFVKLTNNKLNELYPSKIKGSEQEIKAYLNILDHYDLFWCEKSRNNVILAILEIANLLEK